MTQEKLVAKLKGLETEISNSETAVKNAEADVAKKNEAIYQEKLRQIGLRGAKAQLEELIAEAEAAANSETENAPKLTSEITEASGNMAERRAAKKKPHNRAAQDFVP